MQRCSFGILEKQEQTPLQIRVFAIFLPAFKVQWKLTVIFAKDIDLMDGNVEDLHMLQIWRKWVSNHYIYLTFAYQYLSSKYMYLPTL